MFQTRLLKLVSSTTMALTISCFSNVVNAQVNPSTIGIGASILDSLNCGETDFFSFSTAIGEKIVSHVTECSDWGGICSGFASFQFDQCIELVDNDGNSLSNVCTPLSGNNASDRRRSQIGPEVMTNGEPSTISIRDANNRGRGAYSIFLQSTNNPQFTTELFPGTELISNQASCGAVDTYVFHAKTGDRVVLDMVPGNIGNIIPRLELYNASGSAIALPDGGHIDQVLPSTSQYTLLAFSNTSETGSYSINFELNPTPALEITPGSGDYFISQEFDFGLILNSPGIDVIAIGGMATLNGNDITPILAACAIAGTLDSGGDTYRCSPNILFTEGYPPGSYEISVSLNLSNGSTLSDTVTWNILGNVEL